MLQEGIKATMYIKSTQIPNIMNELKPDIVREMKTHTDEIMNSLTNGHANSECIANVTDIRHSSSIC